MSTYRGEQVWLGIDFSGDHKMWRPNERQSNIHIARVHSQPKQLFLTALYPVQQLGEGQPFENLISWLKARDFKAAAIDAPFSVPNKYLPLGGHRALLEQVARMECPKNRPFPSAQDFACGILAGRPLLGNKPLRETERFWRDKNINVRSTLSAGPRGGAAMTAACLTLLQQTECPVWPWHQHRLGESGLLVEAFPAAQLRHWGMELQKYDGNRGEAPVTRAKLVDLLLEKTKIEVADFSLIEKMKECADALDAVICAFAAIAVSTGRIVREPSSMASNDEGQIAVHDLV